jgi:hypothetical protein
LLKKKTVVAAGTADGKIGERSAIESEIGEKLEWNANPDNIVVKI